MGTVSDTLKLTVKFGHLQEDPATIEKNFVSNATIECYPYGPINTMQPSLMVKYQNSEQHPDYQNFNYFYVVEWKRYYFMKPPTYDSGIVYIGGNEDVLMTFKDEILDQHLLMSRVEERSLNNMYYPDSQQIPCCATWTTTEDFPVGFNAGWVLGSTGALVQAI